MQCILRQHFFQHHSGALITPETKKQFQYELFSRRWRPTNFSTTNQEIRYTQHFHQ